MNQHTIQHALQHLPLGDIHYLETATSTNDVAKEFCANNPPNYTVVVSNEQTRGRGRYENCWFTPKDTAIALSIILNQPAIKVAPLEQQDASVSLKLHTVLSALALNRALVDIYNLQPEIKYPNDILLNGKKVAGILAEAQWEGDTLQHIILGIGINVHKGSLPPENQLDYPATTIAHETSPPPSRTLLVKILLENLLRFTTLSPTDLISAWDKQLAFKGRRVSATLLDDERVEGILEGLSATGQLRLHTDDAEELTIDALKRLRPLK